MGAPTPLEGSNPYTGLYQSRQFGTGFLTQVPFYVAQYLDDPPADLVTAMEQTPLVEEAEFFDFSSQVVTVTGSPTSGTFDLAYDGIPTATIAHNAAASAVQTALRALGGQLASVTVAGSAGGPWTVTGFTGAGSVPLQLIDVQQLQLSGGTLPNVVVTTTAEQQGISPF